MVFVRSKTQHETGISTKCTGIGNSLKNNMMSRNSNDRSIK